MTNDELAGIGAVRPRLRQDAVFLRSDGGAYLRSNETAFFLRGQSAYQWVSTLGPYLTGEHTVAELCDGLDEGHRVTVVRMLRALLDRGFAVDVPSADGAGLGPAAQRFRQQLAFLDHAPALPVDLDGQAPPGPARFAAVRAATVRVVGSGELVTAAALTLVRNGVGTVELVTPDDPARHRTQLDAEVAALREAGVESTAVVRDTPETNPDVVLHCALQRGAGPGELSGLFDATRGYAEAGTPLVPVVVGGDTAVLGPVSRPGEGPCWVCAQMRLAADGDPAAAADLWRELALGTPVRPRHGTALSPVVAGMLGTAAGFEIFRLLAGLPTDSVGAVVLQDVETLESGRHRLFAHPCCPLRHDAVATEMPAQRPATDEEWYEQLSVLVGERVGVFGRFTDDPLAQAPLKVARIVVNSPAALAGGRRELTAFDGTSVLHARIRVIGAAVLDYVGQLPDRADVVTGSAASLAAAGHRPVPPGALPTASGAVTVAADDELRWVPARSLVSGEERLVPLAAAYPMSAANAGHLVERTPAGAAVGSGTDELVATGLAGAMAYRAMRDALHGRGRLHPLDEDVIRANDEGLALLKGLHHLGRTVTVHDLPGAAPAHAVLAVTDRQDGPPLHAVGSGLSRADAVAAALRELLGRLQVLGDEGRPADVGDPLLPDFDPRTALPTEETGAASQERRVESTAADVLAALRADGWDALLVDTTSPDVRSAGAPLAGVVLLAGPHPDR